MDDEGVVGGTALGGEYALGGVGAEGEAGETVDGFCWKGDGAEVVEMAGGEAESCSGVLVGEARTIIGVEGDGGGIALQHLRREGHDPGTTRVNISSPPLACSVPPSAQSPLSSPPPSGQPVGCISPAASASRKVSELETDRIFCTLYSLCEHINVTVFSTSRRNASDWCRSNSLRKLVEMSLFLSVRGEMLWKKGTVRPHLHPGHHVYRFGNLSGNTAVQSGSVSGAHVKAMSKPNVVGSCIVHTLHFLPIVLHSKLASLTCSKRRLRLLSPSPGPV